MVIEHKKKSKLRMRWIVLSILLLLHFYQLPFYYTQPGEAKTLAPVIDVEGGFKEENGSFMLTTVKMGKANAYFYAWAHLSDYREIIPEEQIVGPEETDEEYFHRQAMMMASSQEAAKMIAYERANKNISIDYHGIMVSSFIEGMPAEKVLQPGDRITSVNGVAVTSIEQLNEEVAENDNGEDILLTITREGETLEVITTTAPFPKEVSGGDERIGLGILYPVVDRTVSFSPDVTIDVSKIGGPSAGLMFSLEIYNQLVKEDITKGYQIAGTGTINEEGNVGRIGGVEQKVVAAHKASVDYFFVPKEGAREDSNYKEALRTAEEIGTKTKVIGVETFDEALEFLQELPPKQ
ncbi:SepM family pheromone-processing serine protease [Alkalihalobacterium bogoriense]|uniref:SepM family pheromone-processing serine protease n=1 Tax=Alkalihalobacterium bogoriense TaxID=246272 RepID=UPI00047E8805|nr:SepM family pheromone-processing serine protease [Alkalihalobacterium bogoriense]